MEALELTATRPLSSFILWNVKPPWYLKLQELFISKWPTQLYSQSNQLFKYIPRLEVLPSYKCHLLSSFLPRKEGKWTLSLQRVALCRKRLVSSAQAFKTVSQGHQVAVRANGFSFSFFPTSLGTLGFAGGGAELGSVNLVESWEHEALASVFSTEDSSRGSYGNIW